MISYSDLKKGVKIILNNQPYEITESSFLFKGRGHSVLQSKIKNLISGDIISRTFHPSEVFKEAEISKIEIKFLYSHRDRYFFSKKENLTKRFDLTAEQIGQQRKFLKPNQILEGIIFKDKVVNIILPIKINLKVIEAPPGIKGERAQSGTKPVTLETGAVINVPLFIEIGDIIEINTETGEYVKRVF